MTRSKDAAPAPETVGREEGVCIHCGGTVHSNPTSLAMRAHIPCQIKANRATPPAAEREGLCMVCNREYPTWYAPSELWNPVMRRPDGSDEYPFLCPTCFCNLAEERGVGDYFVLALARPPAAERERIAEEIARAIMCSPDVHLHWTHEQAKERRGYPHADRILAALRAPTTEEEG